jgi:hypothetical protein
MGRMNPTVRKGVVIIALSLSFLTGWTYWSNTRAWTLIDKIPVSLAKGSHYSWPDLRVNFDTRYFIDIYVDNNMDPKRLGCMLGVWNKHEITCDRSAALRVQWVLSGGGALQQATSDETLDDLADTGKAQEVFRDLGIFRARRNHYRLDLYVLSDSAALNAANPRLDVSVQGSELESNLVFTGLIRAACYGFALIGALISCWGLITRDRMRYTGV